MLLNNNEGCKEFAEMIIRKSVNERNEIINEFSKVCTVIEQYWKKRNLSLKETKEINLKNPNTSCEVQTEPESISLSFFPIFTAKEQILEKANTSNKLKNPPKKPILQIPELNKSLSIHSLRKNHSVQKIKHPKVSK